MFLNGKIM